MRRRILSLLVPGFLVLLAPPSHSEWRSFGYQEGLRGSAGDILEDSSGNMWFAGATSGASRYDGVNWTFYTEAAAPVYEGAHCMLEDRSGNLWFANQLGVSRYDGTNWTSFRPSERLIVVTGLVEDSSGDLWFCTYHNGVTRYDGTTWTSYTLADGLPTESFTDIMEDSSGNLWLASGVGAVRYDGVSWTLVTTADGLADNHVNVIYEDTAGNLWFGVQGLAVSRFDGASWTTYSAADGFQGGSVDAIREDRWGNLWFGGLHGVHRFDGVNWKTYTTQDGLLDDWVDAIFEDSSGNLWFGTSVGVSLFDGETWSVLTTENGLPKKAVSAVCEDTSGGFWIATWDPSDGTGGGVQRFDGESWTPFPQAGGLTSYDVVRGILEDRSGDLWFGGYALIRYDGSNWISYNDLDGLVLDMTGPYGEPVGVGALYEDSAGGLWVGTWMGVSRFDGTSWHTLTPDDGLVPGYVTAIAEDRSGNMWFGVYGDDYWVGNGGVSRYDGERWTTFTAENGLAGPEVVALLEDDTGNLWVGIDGRGASRFDGDTWRTFAAEDGLGGAKVMLQDRQGTLWFGGGSGLTRYDGTYWAPYTTADGLPSSRVEALIEDGRGRLWIGTLNGLAIHFPDRVAPQTVISPRPPALTPGRDQTITFGAAFKETRLIRFSHSFDGSSWSEWATTSFLSVEDLADGPHVFSVRSMDRVANVDPTPAVVRFEVDGTAPVPVVSSPASGQVLRGSVTIVGTAGDPRFKEYRLDERSGIDGSWTTLAQSTSPVESGALGVWNTLDSPDGVHDLRLTVVDTLGLAGVDVVQVVVDNVFPPADQTSPARVPSKSGGDVYTTDRRMHVYFPPNSFSEDVVVTITRTDTSLVPAILESGIERVDSGGEIRWGELGLQKSAILEFTLEQDDPGRPPAGYAVYFSPDRSSWDRLGGTLDESKVLTVPIRRSGTYAVFSESSLPSGKAAVAGLSLTPRVFAPLEASTPNQVAISFSLGQPARTTVRVYTRSGRLVRKVATGLFLNAGANVVRWDGRDGSGRLVGDGLYIVTLQALGETRQQTLAVTR